jgi:hypothetical protein
VTYKWVVLSKRSGRRIAGRSGLATKIEPPSH